MAVKDAKIVVASLIMTSRLTIADRVRVYLYSWDVEYTDVFRIIV